MRSIDELISAGDHLAKCRTLDLGMTSTGKEQAKIQFILCDEEDPFYDRVINGFVYFSDKAMKHALRALRAMGWKGTDIDELPGLAQMGELANVVRLTIEHDEYKGKISHKVKWISDPNGASADRPLDDDKRKDLRDRMRKAIVEIEGGEASPEEPVQAAFAEDLPFISISMHADSPVRRWNRWP
jgi:hypothetical protein